MLIQYEAGDRVVDLRTGVHYTVRKAELKVNHDQVPVTSYQILTMTDTRVLTSQEVLPVQHAMALMSPMGELHGIIIVPSDIAHGASLELLQELADEFNQNLEGTDVDYAMSEEQFEEWLHRKNGDNDDETE